MSIGHKFVNCFVDQAFAVPNLFSLNKLDI